MQKRIKYAVKSVQPELIEICGRFRPNGSSALSLVEGTNKFGRGWTASRSNTGIFLLTITGKCGTFLHGHAELHSASVADSNAIRVGLPSENTSGNTEVILTHYGEDAGGVMAAEDITSDAANWVSFRLVFQNLKATRGLGMAKGKPMIAALISGLSSKGKGSEEEEEEEAPPSSRSGESMDLAKEAFGEMFDALKSGDREAFIEAGIVAAGHAAEC